MPVKYYLENVRKTDLYEKNHFYSKKYKSDYDQRLLQF